MQIIKEHKGIGLSKILMTYSIIGFLLAVKLYAGEDQSRQPSLPSLMPSVVSQKDSHKLSSMRITTNSISVAPQIILKQPKQEQKEQKESKTTKTIKKSTKSTNSNLISWLWTDRPGTPSIMVPKNGNGNWPKFK